MTENTNNVETVVENEAEVKVDEPKTYSQEEVDNIVRGRVAREKAKTDKVKAELKEAKKQLNENSVISSILEEYGDVKGDTESKIKALAENYDITEDKLKELKDSAKNKPNQNVLAYMNAKMFIESNDEDDMLEEYNRLKEIPEASRNANEKELFKQLMPRFKEKELEEVISSDRKWFEENNEGVSFMDLIQSEDFKDFMDGTNMSVRKGLEKYVKLKGTESLKNSFPDKKAETVSTGSAKDSGASKLKEYYSPEDVDNLSSKDLDDPVIFERVRQSMAKWK